MLELLVRVNTDREFYRHTARIFRAQQLDGHMRSTLHISCIANSWIRLARQQSFHLVEPAVESVYILHAMLRDRRIPTIRRLRRD